MACSDLGNGQSNSSHQMTSPYVHECPCPCACHDGSGRKFLLIIKQNNIFRTQISKTDHYFTCIHYIWSLIHSVLMQMIELTGIKAWMMLITQALGLSDAHVSLPHNYATTHPADRLSSINLLRNTNWGFYCMLHTWYTFSGGKSTHYSLTCA